MPDKKGLALFFVLSMLLITTILANIVLTIISNQSRLTHHKVSRIQAYYATQAGVNYALEKLRLNNDACWPAAGSYTRQICRSGCLGCDINDADLPNSIEEVNIFVDNPNTGPNNTRRINVTAVYTYTNP